MTREEAIEILEERWRYSRTYKYTDAEIREAFDMAIKALEQTDEDCISREALLKRINNAEENFRADNVDTIEMGVEDPFVDGVLSGVFNIREMVMQAPSVTPKWKTGHWINPYGGNWHCDKCDHEQGRKSNFCPNCGARMIESEVRNEQR